MGITSTKNEGKKRRCIQLQAWSLVVIMKEIIVEKKAIEKTKSGIMTFFFSKKNRINFASSVKGIEGYENSGEKTTVEREDDREKKNAAYERLDNKDCDAANGR